MRAAIYLRISQDPTGQAAGVTRQREDCEDLVSGQGWDLHETYTDNDISASTGRVRPGYRKLLEDIQSGHVDAVVAWHPDRLYRKLADLEGLIEAIEARNVIMRTVKAGEIDLSTPTGRMLARILSATAQAEGEIKADRWKRSWRQGREAGAVAKTGTRLYGYTRDGQIIEAEAEIARGMAADVLAGKTLLSIGERLDAAGIRGTRDGAWTMAAIKQYLTNPRIAGWSTLKGEIVAEGEWEPVLDRETWESVRALLTSRTRAYAPRKSLLNGLIFCGCDCGCTQRLITSNARGKRTYRCPRRPGMMGCGHLSGNAEPIEEYVEGLAQALLQTPEARRRITALRAEPTGAQGEIADLDLRITELERQLDEPGTPVATILRAIDRAKDRQAALLERVAKTTTEPLPDRGGPWPTDLRRRRALVELVVERVELARAARRGAGVFDTDRVKITRRD